MSIGSAANDLKPSLDGWNGARSSSVEVARVPVPVVPSVQKRLGEMVKFMDDVLDRDDLLWLICMMAGVVHESIVGAKLEVLAMVKRRALETRLGAEEDDDLIAAAELTDLAEELEQIVLEEAGREPD